MSWNRDRIGLLVFVATLLIGVLAWGGSALHADVQDLKAFRAAAGSTLESIDKRLARIEGTLERILERTQ